MSPGRRLSPKWEPESDIDEKDLLNLAVCSFRQVRGVVSKRSNSLCTLVPLLLCGGRKKALKREPTHPRSDQKMCFHIMADNGAVGWGLVEMEALKEDGKTCKILVSERLALFLRGPKELWTPIPTGVLRVEDEEGVQHDCEYCFKVSCRWETDNRTRDEMVYVSPQLRNKPRLNERGSMAKLDLLVPRGLAPDPEAWIPAVQTNYHLPRQTQQERDRQTNNNKAANAVNEAAIRAAQEKREKKFDSLKKEAEQRAKEEAEQRTKKEAEQRSG